MTRYVCSILALTVTAGVAIAQAQSLSYENLHVRDRVLIVARNGFEVDGFITHIDTDTLFIVPIDKAASYVWPVKDIARLRLYVGQETGAWNGFVYGAVGGFVAGFIYGRATGGGAEESNPWEKKDTKSMLAGMMGFTIGGLVGLSVGSFVEKERWEAVRLAD